MTDYRELIEEGIARLSESEKAELAHLDSRAKALLDGYGGQETWDVAMLRDTVAIAHPEYRRAA